MRDEQFRRYFRQSAGDQLGLVLRQVDHLTDLARLILEADSVGIFYQPRTSGDWIGLGFACDDSNTSAGPASLERLASQVPPNSNIWCACDTLTEHLDESELDDPGGHVLHRSWLSDQPGDLRMVAVAAKRPDNVSPMVSRQLDSICAAVQDSLGITRHLQTLGEFSKRLSKMLKASETELVTKRFNETLRTLLEHLQREIPNDGAALIGKDPRSREFVIMQHLGELPSPDFPDCLIEVINSAIGSPPADEPDDSLETVIPVEPSGAVRVVAELLDTSGSREYALAVWCDAGAALKADDRLLLHLFPGLIGPILYNASSVRRLVVSQQRLYESSERLAEAEALAALTDMTSGVAHDLNNVIGGILGRLQLMGARIEDPRTSDELHRLESMALDGARTIASLQEFSSSTAYTQPESVDLCNVVDACLEDDSADWYALAAKKSVTVAARIEPDRALIDGDGGKLSLALEHVLQNAVEHSPESSQVTVGIEERPDSFCVTVTDRGPGIPAELRSKVFFPFFSTKQGVRSSGLGLAVVHGTVVRHGGTAEVDPDYSDGARLILEFKKPLSVEEDSDVTRRGHRKSGLDILVVDDDELILEVLCDMLTIDGHNPVACKDAFGALEAAEAYHFDVMITDLGMPGMSGLDLAGLISESSPDTAIGMITGWGSQLDHHQAKLKGIRQVLAKPFHLSDVKEMVRNLITAP